MPSTQLKLLCLVLLLHLFALPLPAQTSSPETGKKGSIFLYWGYNRSKYSTTNLHFNGPTYDFTVYDVVAHDRPSKVGLVYVNPATFTIPQYNYRAGYFITDRWALSLGLDHMKYVVDADQMTTISGVITEEASSVYQGSYLNEPIQLKEDLLRFEHTDGLNLVTLDVEYLLPLISFGKRQFRAYWNFGIGGIWAVTKTNVKVMGDGLDNDFHVAGYSMAAKTGPRIEFRDRVFLLYEMKGGYMSLPSVLIKNAEPEIGDHTFTFLEGYLALGMNLNLRRKKKD